MLNHQRQRIDAIDQALVRLYEERMEVVKEIIAIKKEEGLPILDQGRENLVITKVQGYLTDESLAQDISELYQEILRLSRRFQEQQ